MLAFLIPGHYQMLKGISSCRAPSSTPLATSAALTSTCLTPCSLTSPSSIHPWLLVAVLSALNTIIPLQVISASAEARLTIEVTPLAAPCLPASAHSSLPWPGCILPLPSTTTTAAALSSGKPQTRGALQPHLADGLLLECRRLITACTQCHLRTAEMRMPQTLMLLHAPCSTAQQLVVHSMHNSNTRQCMLDLKPGSVL